MAAEEVVDSDKFGGPSVSNDEEGVYAKVYNENSGNDEDSTKKNDHSPPPISCFTDSTGNLKFVNMIVRYPCEFFSFMMGLCILCTILLFVLSGKNSPFTEGTNDYDLYDRRSIAYDSLRLAVDDVKGEQIRERRGNRPEADKDSKVQEEVGDATWWIYEGKTDEGVFTEEGVALMREAESTITNTKNGNYSDYCVLEYTDYMDGGGGSAKCRKPLSVLNIYYASVWNSTLAKEVMDDLTPEKREIYNTLTPCVEFGVRCDAVETALETYGESAYATSIKIQTIMSTWDGEGGLNPDVGEVTMFIAYMNELLLTRSEVNFFFDEDFSIDNPVTQYARSILYWGELLEGTDDEDESEKKLKSFILDNLLDSWNEIQNDNNSQIKTYFFQGALIFDIILVILRDDGLKAIASFLAVFFYLRIMIGSWFLAAVTIFEIFMSLPIAWITFSYILQIKYFSTLNILCIFIVVAIGADDVFVFMDAYKQSASKGKEVVSSLETRMSWVFRRAGWAMLLTSMTTFAAFLVTLSSPIANTRGFGIFASFVILFDYFLVMTLFCTSVVIYHNRFEMKECCCSCVCWKKNEPTSTEISLAKEGNGEEVELDRISVVIQSFFKDKLAPFILRGRNRIIIAIPLAALITVTAIFSARLQPTSKAEQFLDDDHPIQKAITILTEEFPTTRDDRPSQVHFVWGLDSVTRNGVNQLFDPEAIGKAVFAEDFEFNEDCQTRMLDACETLRTDERFEEFILQNNGLRSVDCFVEELGAFNTLGSTISNKERCIAVRTKEWADGDWQVPPSELASTMKSFSQVVSCNADDGRTKVENYYKDTMGWDGDSVRYAGISLESTLLNPNGGSPEDETRIHYDAFIKFAEELDDTMSDVCQSKTIMTDLDQQFVFMNNQRVYRRSAIMGSGLGVVVAFAVLLVSTRKLHVSFFACLTIGAVLIGVIGSTTIFGWTLGTIESILISILAGFSIDYVIHLAHAYVHAKGNTEERIIEAYGDMGISVFSGMLTSVVASIPLFFCTLTFFAKFGTFLCTTIVLSWIFANFGFMCLLAQFKIPIGKNWW